MPTFTNSHCHNFRKMFYNNNKLEKKRNNSIGENFHKFPRTEADSGKTCFSSNDREKNSTIFVRRLRRKRHFREMIAEKGATSVKRLRSKTRFPSKACGHNEKSQKQPFPSKYCEKHANSDKGLIKKTRFLSKACEKTLFLSKEHEKDVISAVL